MKKNYFIQADAKAGMSTLPANCINCNASSPPYYGLRDYGWEGQHGLEDSPEEYIHNQVQVYEEVKRTLREDGTAWIVIGDSYWGGKGLSGAPDPEYQAQRAHLGISMNKKYQQVGSGPGKVRITDKKHPVIKQKDLIGIPWTLALALRDYGAKDLRALKVLRQVMDALTASYDGKRIPDKVINAIQELEKEYSQAKGNAWYLRQDVIWSKPNPMPESMEDRCTRAHEYIFLLSKNGKRNIWWRARDTREWVTKEPDLAETVEYNGKMVPRWRGFKYYFDTDAIATPYILPGINGDPKQKVAGFKGIPPGHVEHSNVDRGRDTFYKKNGANKKSVWTVAAKPIDEAHFATFPHDLISDCIKAGCPKDGLVLDHYVGSGTTAITATSFGRDFIGIDLDTTLAVKKYREVFPLLLAV